MGYIYKITNQVNSKIYVGKTVTTIANRWLHHLDDYKKFDWHLYRAMRKYGVDKFSIEQIEECDDEIINEREIYWIEKLDTFKNGYNSTIGGEGRKQTPREEVIKRWEKGYSIKELALYFNVWYSTIADILKEQGYYDKEEAQKLQEKLKKNDFDFDDFLAQLRQMSRMGGIESILKLLPGGNKLAGMGELDTSKFNQMEAIICSMTKKERAKPEILDMSRRKRIARGSGTKVEEVSQLIKQFVNMRKMMKSTGMFGKLFSSGALPTGMGDLGMGMGGFGGLGGGMGGFRPSFSRGSNFTPKKKKRKKK